MLEDEFLKLRFKCGSRAALERIYEKYEHFLITVAVALCGWQTAMDGEGHQDTSF